MPNQTITLYVDANFTSPYAMSVFVCLQEKGLPISLELVDLDDGANLRAPFRDLGLTGRVPLLVHGALTLSESSAIIEYLEDHFGAPGHAPVLPQAPLQRAQARQIQAWLRSDLLPIRAERSTLGVFCGHSAAPLSASAQDACERLVRIAERLIDGPNLFDQWCIADTELALMLQRLIKQGDPLPQRLRDYAEGQWQRATVQRWVDQRRA
jgi:glutathione S-transferase